MFKSKRLAAPYLVWMVIFIVVPLLLVAYYAFTDKQGNFTLENVAGIGQYTSVFARSIWLALIATVICLVMAFPISYRISRLRGARQSLMLMLIMLPMWMNFLLRTYAWMSLLENNGLINRFFGLFGLGPFQMINTQGAVVLGMVYNYLPFMILPLYSIMTKIDNSLIEAAQDLGKLGVGRWVRGDDRNAHEKRHRDHLAWCAGSRLDSGGLRRFGQDRPDETFQQQLAHLKDRVPNRSS